MTIHKNSITNFRGFYQESGRIATNVLSVSEVAEGDFGEGISPTHAVRRSANQFYWVTFVLLIGSLDLNLSLLSIEPNTGTDPIVPRADPNSPVIPNDMHCIRLTKHLRLGF